MPTVDFGAFGSRASGSRASSNSSNELFVISVSSPKGEKRARLCTEMVDTFTVIPPTEIVTSKGVKIKPALRKWKPPDIDRTNLINKFSRPSRMSRGSMSSSEKPTHVNFTTKKPEKTKESAIFTSFEKWANHTTEEATQRLKDGQFGVPLYCTMGWRKLRLAAGCDLPPPPSRLNMMCSPAIDMKQMKKCSSASAMSPIAINVQNTPREWAPSPSPMKGAAVTASLLLAPTPPQTDIPVKTKPKRPLTAPVHRPRHTPTPTYAPPSALCLQCGLPLFGAEVCKRTGAYHFTQTRPHSAAATASWGG